MADMTPKQHFISCTISSPELLLQHIVYPMYLHSAGPLVSFKNSLP